MRMCMPVSSCAAYGKASQRHNVSKARVIVVVGRSIDKVYGLAGVRRKVKGLSYETISGHEPSIANQVAQVGPSLYVGCIKEGVLQ